MTDRKAATGADCAEALRTALRRGAHELRNAQNAAAVNLEVVRSRVAAGNTSNDSLRSFIDNAAKGLEDSARFAESLVALCSAATTAMASGRLGVRELTASGAVLELSIAPEMAAQLVSQVSQLAAAAGFGVEAAEAGVIFRIPPDNETNRA